MSSAITTTISSQEEELATQSTVIIPVSISTTTTTSSLENNGSASGLAAAIERLAASLPDGDEVDEGDDGTPEGGNSTGPRFYWDTSDPSAPSPTLPVVVADHCRWIALQTWSTMEVVGEFFAEILGLQNSRYEWAMELARRHEEDAEEEELRTVRRQRWAEIQAATREQARIDRLREGKAGAEEKQGLVGDIEENENGEESEEGQSEEVVDVKGGKT